MDTCIIANSNFYTRLTIKPSDILDSSAKNNYVAIDLENTLYIKQLTHSLNKL